jgi:hypothetical protein
VSYHSFGREINTLAMYWSKVKGFVATGIVYEGTIIEEQLEGLSV